MGDAAGYPVIGVIAPGRSLPVTAPHGRPRHEDVVDPVGMEDAAVDQDRPVTPKEIAERLRKAVALQALNTKLGVEDNVAGQEPETKATIEAVVPELAGVDDDLVAHAAEALSWLGWLSPDDAGIVRARLEGAPWKAICWRFGISRPTADRRWRYGLGLIAWRLNGNLAAAPSLRRMLRVAKTPGLDFRPPR